MSYKIGHKWGSISPRNGMLLIIRGLNRPNVINDKACIPNTPVKKSIINPAPKQMTINAHLGVLKGRESTNKI